MFAPLREILAALRRNETTTEAFVEVWRRQTEFLESLPESYRRVLDDLLMRLESSGLFSQESCSFSRDALLDNLQLWLAKAERYRAGGKDGT